jgi:hypothetical protein
MLYKIISFYPYIKNEAKVVFWEKYFLNRNSNNCK